MKENFQFPKPKYNVPEGYFDNLQKRLNDIPAHHPKSVRVLRLRAWGWASIAAAFLLGSILVWNFGKTDLAKPYSDQHLELMASELSDELIYEYYSQISTEELTSNDAWETLMEYGIEEDDLYNY